MTDQTRHERIVVTLQQEAANGRASYSDMADAVLAALADDAIAHHGDLIVHAVHDMTGDLAYVEGMVDGYMIAAWLQGSGTDAD